MKTTSTTARLAVLALGSLLLANVHAAAPRYTVTDLGTLGGDFSSGYGVNASGQVCGSSSIIKGDFHSHAARWTGTTATDLGVLDGSGSYGASINASGQIAGAYTLNTGARHAVRWTGTKGVVLGPNSSEADAINTSGQVAGSADLLGNTTTHAVRWSGTTGLDLGALPNSFRSSGFGINDSGQVTGSSTLPFPNTSVSHAVRWTGTTAVDLGTLGGTISEGYAINASGQVAGYSDLTGDAATHAVRWTGTKATDLGTLGGTSSHGYAINASGDVTGMSQISPTLTTEHAFLYTGGKMYDLESLLVAGSGVTNLRINFTGNSINDKGQIAASGNVNGGSQHALLLTPVPVVSIAVTGATDNGSILHFSAGTTPGLSVKIQSSPDKKIWTDIPDISGPYMTEDPGSPGNYHLDTTFYPTGDAIYFKAVVIRPTFADVSSPPLGPFKLTRAELSISLQATSTSDKLRGSIVRAGDDITYIFSVINKGTATARNLKIVAKLPTYLDSKTNLPYQFDLSDVPLDSHNNPSISFGGTYHPPSSSSALDATIVWDAGDLAPDPNVPISAAFTLHITSKVRTHRTIGVPNDYEVYGVNFQPPYSATGQSSGYPYLPSEVRDPISFTAKATSSKVAPGGLIHYTFTLTNFSSSPVAHAAAVISVPQFTRFADSYTLPNGSTTLGVGGVRLDGSTIESELVYTTNGSNVPQLLLDLGSLAAAGSANDSITFGVNFQAQWVDPAQAPRIGAFDYYATFFNADLINNPYNSSGPKITQYDLFRLKFVKAQNTTSQTPGPIDFISFIQQTTHETALSYYDSGDVSVPISGSIANQPILYLTKKLSSQPTNIQNGIDTAKPGDTLTFQVIAANFGKSVANDVYVEDGLPDHTKYIPGSEHLIRTPLTASTTASSLKAYPDKDGHHVRFEELNLLPKDGLQFEYSVQVDGNVAVGTLLLPAAVLNSSGLPEGGVGASSIGSSSTPETSEGYYSSGAVKVTASFQLALSELYPLIPNPIVSTDINVTANALTAIYNKNWSAKPQTNQKDNSTLIPGVERYYFHYENLGNAAVRGVKLVFPLPAHTAFYRASFVTITSDSAGTLISPPKGQPIDTTTVPPTYFINASITPPAGANGGFLSTGGKTTFSFDNLPAAGQDGCKGDVMVEVIVQSDAVAANGSLIGGDGAAPVYIQDTPLTHRTTAKIFPILVASPPATAAPLAPATTAQMTSNAATPILPVPSVGILPLAPQEVKAGERFQVEIGIFNNGDIGARPSLVFRIPDNTKFISVDAGKSYVQRPVASSPVQEVIAHLATNNGIFDVNDPVPLLPSSGAGLTITLEATGDVGSEIVYADTHVAFEGVGIEYAPLPVTRIVDSPKIGLSASITGAPLYHNVVNGSDLFMVRLTDAGDKIMVLGAANIVGQGGGNIVAQGGGNIVGQGGGNLIVSGDSSLGIANTTVAAIVAQGGGNIIVGEKCTIVGQGGGNIVAQGGGNIVGQGGGNVVAQGGLNLVVYQTLVNTNGSNFYAAGGGKIVTLAGVNFNSLAGTSLQFVTKGGNIMRTGGENFHLSP